MDWRRRSPAGRSAWLTQAGGAVVESPSSRWRHAAVARDEQPPARIRKAARSSGATARRLSVAVEITRVRGPDAQRLAEVQLEAIREVLEWALTQNHARPANERKEDRAA